MLIAVAEVLVDGDIAMIYVVIEDSCDGGFLCSNALSHGQL